MQHKVICFSNIFFFYKKADYCVCIYREREEDTNETEKGGKYFSELPPYTTTTSPPCLPPLFSPAFLHGCQVSPRIETAAGAVSPLSWCNHKLWCLLFLSVASLVPPPTRSSGFLVTGSEEDGAAQNSGVAQVRNGCTRQPVTLSVPQPPPYPISQFPEGWVRELCWKKRAWGRGKDRREGHSRMPFRGSQGSFIAHVQNTFAWRAIVDFLLGRTDDQDWQGGGREAANKRIARKENSTRSDTPFVVSSSLWD